MIKQHALNSSENFLDETATLNFSHPAMLTFIAKIPRFENQNMQAIAIYEYVRNAFLYDPYHLDLRPESLKASTIVNKNRAWCVEKAVVAAACFRAFGFQARLGFGVVVNHIGVEKLTSYLKRPEIVFHGYVEALVDGVWSKCTPAFDDRICRVSKVPALVWNTKSDSLFQSYIGENKFMEYIHFYGEFSDVPFELMHREMNKFYPHLFENPVNDKDFSFQFSNNFIQ